MLKHSVRGASSGRASIQRQHKRMSLQVLSAMADGGLQKVHRSVRQVLMVTSSKSGLSIGLLLVNVPPCCWVPWSSSFDCYAWSDEASMLKIIFSTGSDENFQTNCGNADEHSDAPLSCRWRVHNSKSVPKNDFVAVSQQQPWQGIMVPSATRPHVFMSRCRHAKPNCRVCRK